VSDCRDFVVAQAENVEPRCPDGVNARRLVTSGRGLPRKADLFDRNRYDIRLVGDRPHELADHKLVCLPQCCDFMR
jgi:hypothetical protein